MARQTAPKPLTKVGCPDDGKHKMLRYVSDGTVIGQGTRAQMETTPVFGGRLGKQTDVSTGQSITTPLNSHGLILL